jgi:hypothetical protein
VPVVKHGDDMMQAFDMDVPPFRPVMPENFVPFYTSYIPVKCEGYPDREKAALAALAERDQYLIERAMRGEPDDREWLHWRRAAHALGLM